MKYKISPTVRSKQVSDGCYAYYFTYCGREYTASGYAKYSWAKSAGLRHFKRLYEIDHKETEWA